MSGRDVAHTAAARCLCYAAFSELTASPHDIDTHAAVRERIGVGRLLDYAGDLDGLLQEILATAPERLRADYSGLFEVGSQGPPVPIREDLQTGQLGSTREDIVRFYDYFGYALSEKFAWAPDHLSVELEFMHYLCYREAEAGDDALSYQLAQRDFTERHLVRWLPALATAVEKHAGGTLYGRIVAALRQFVASDYDWQCGTISPTSVQ